MRMVFRGFLVVLAATPAVGAVPQLAGLAVAPLPASISAQKQLEIRELWTSEGVDGLLLASTDGVAETPHGMIWVSDPRINTVWAIDPRARRATVVAGMGEGPGEVDAPDRIAALSDGNMAVFDMGKIEILTPEGIPVRRVRLPLELSWPKGFAALPSGGFAISGGIYSIDAAVHEFDADGRLVRSWGAKSPALGFRERIVGSGGALYAGANGLLYSQSAPHRITEYAYGQEDTLVGRIVAEMPELLVHPGDGVIVESGEGAEWQRSFHPYFPQSRAVFELPDGRILNVVVYQDDGYSVWQLFGAQPDAATGLRPLDAVGRTDAAYVPWFLCPDGTILATRIALATGEPIVVRLRVE